MLFIFCTLKLSNIGKDNFMSYWLFLLKAKAQKELGDKKGARASAETCIKMAVGTIVT